MKLNYLVFCMLLILGLGSTAQAWSFDVRSIHNLNTSHSRFVNAFDTATPPYLPDPWPCDEDEFYNHADSNFSQDDWLQDDDLIFLHERMTDLYESTNNVYPSQEIQGYNQEISREDLSDLVLEYYFQQ